MRPVLLLKGVNQHVCRIVSEALCFDGLDDIVFAEILELLIGVLRSFDPERIVLGRLALIRNLSIEQAQSRLHRYESLDELRR